jgi:hypothetical protein
VIVLAEGKRDQRFVWRYLRDSGFEPHEIRREAIPDGIGGAGERWVIDRYATAVKDFRKRAAKTALIVVLDADKGEVNRRAGQLESALRQVGIAARASDEAIVHLIPRRHIETWILHLTGKVVNEATDYHNEKVDDLIPEAAANFREWTAQPPTHCLPSLSIGIEETKRLV